MSFCGQATNFHLLEVVASQTHVKLGLGHLRKACWLLRTLFTEGSRVYASEVDSLGVQGSRASGLVEGLKRFTYQLTSKAKIWVHHQPRCQQLKRLKDSTALRPWAKSAAANERTVPNTYRKQFRADNRHLASAIHTYKHVNRDLIPMQMHPHNACSPDANCQHDHCMNVTSINGLCIHMITCDTHTVSVSCHNPAFQRPSDHIDLQTGPNAHLCMHAFMM